MARISSFLLFLPPLLFLDGWNISKQALRREARTILALALGLVIFTVRSMGLLLHWLIPDAALAVAFGWRPCCRRPIR